MAGRQSRIVVFVQDTGHARVLTPVLQRLAGEPNSFDVQILGHREAVPAFSEAGLTFRDAATVFDVPLADDRARAYLDKVKPDLVMTGPTHPHTVTGDLSALRLLRAAKQSGRRTLVILDHWQGLDRFAEDGAGRDAYAPAYLGVMDEWTREQLQPTLRTTHIEVVGHPYLERIRQQGMSKDRAALRVQCRARYGIPPGEIVWVLVSQVLIGRDDPRLRKSVLDLSCGTQGLSEGIRELASAHAKRNGRRVRVVCRPHPKERAVLPVPANPERALALASSEETLLLADLLIGWDSMMLFEGFFAGVPVLTLSFLSEQYARVDLERLEIGGHCKTWEDVRQCIEGLNGTRPAPQVHDRYKEIVVGATDRAERLVRRALMN